MAKVVVCNDKSSEKQANDVWKPSAALLLLIDAASRLNEEFLWILAVCLMKLADRPDSFLRRQHRSNPKPKSRR